jgi:phage baseplate assembly protein W
VLDRRANFLGTGWAYPLAIDPRGRIALALGERSIERSIEIILSTAKGERRMRPEFGCGIHDLLFAPNDANTHGLIQSEVAEALGWWEPRIEVVAIDVETHEDDPALLLVNIQYLIRATNDNRNLVYPFYLLPGEE